MVSQLHNYRRKNCLTTSTKRKKRKLVAHLPLYKELQSMGVDAKRVEIFQFCDARIAYEMMEQAILVRDNVREIMEAGASGDL